MPPVPLKGRLRPDSLYFFLHCCMQNEKMHAGADKLIFRNAKELRSKPTHAEELLWNFLRTKPSGFKFRRQHPFSIYILDFYCHALKLVIEVDGSIHNEADVKEADQIRQEFLEKEGLLVVRFTNNEVTYEMGNVISTLAGIVCDRAQSVK